MKKLTLFIACFAFLVSNAVAGDFRNGIVVGVDYQITQHTNPYVHYSGDRLNPTNLVTFNDETRHVYFPFQYSGYSKNGFAEVSTFSWHLIIVGIINLLSPSKEYVYSTDKVYVGDSFADGYIPVFNKFEQNTSQYWNRLDGKGIEASYKETDFFRIAFGGRFFSSIPLLLGLQGGWGAFGVHFANIQEGHEPSEANSDGPGLVNFNEMADLYYGVNIGFAEEMFGGQLFLLSLQYDWHFFIKGQYGNKNQLKGNRIRAELNWFPFSEDSAFGDLFFNAYYIQNSVPWLKQFNIKMPVQYENTTIAFSIRYFII